MSNNQTISSSLPDEIGWIRLSSRIPAAGLIGQVGAGFERGRLDESEDAFQLLARLERGTLGENVLDCLVAADCAGYAVERYTRAGNAVAGRWAPDADEPSSGPEIPFLTVSWSLRDEGAWICLPRTVPPAGLFHEADAGLSVR